MPKLSVPLTKEQHRAIKIKAAEIGLSQAEVARQLLLSWERGEEGFSVAELYDLRSGMDMLVSEGYGDQPTNDLIDKLGRMIDEENTKGR